jgi:hypothetical protein
LERPGPLGNCRIGESWPLSTLSSHPKLLVSSLSTKKNVIIHLKITETIPHNGNFEVKKMV